jgi:hypothetical protein
MFSLCVFYSAALCFPPFVIPASPIVIPAPHCHSRAGGNPVLLLFGFSLESEMSSDTERVFTNKNDVHPYSRTGRKKLLAEDLFCRNKI